MIDDVLKETKERMRKSVQVLQSDLRNIRTGRASPALVERLQVDYYGTQVPLNQLSGISAPEPRLLVIRPYDPSSLPEIEKAILKSELGLTPSNDGKVIRLSIPRLTEERRLELVRMVQKRVEEGRVAVRNCRRDGLQDMKELEKEKLISEDDFYRGKDRIQELTDKYVDKMDEIGAAKEEQIMEV
ncbi:MAG: ribosome recycling factor [Anaerolineae bacterium]|nr:ribosome recycling factor [Anaerolineae bacterium]NIN99424.1 ribosome recycling factor [Anaerolineae bacterium]NIQ82289.1 ribosome recycling factor [Anaerolineae bacterium]